MPDDNRRRYLLAKGAEVAKMLEEIMAGKEVDLAALPVHRGEDEETRARRFLEQLDRCIKAWGTARYGHCAVCGAEIGAAALDQAPWTERCPQHPG